MSFATGSSRLCKSCRADILRIFERGFCDATLPSRTTRRPLVKRRNHTPPRPLSQNNKHLSNGAHYEDPDAGQLNPAEQARTNARTHHELATLQKLETLLGRPIEHAIEEDRRVDASADESKAEGNDGGRNDTGEYEVTTATPHALGHVQMHKEDIVKEARHLYRDTLPDNVLSEEQKKLYKRLYGEPEKASRSYSSKAKSDDAVDTESSEDGGIHALLDTDGQEIELLAQDSIDTMARGSEQEQEQGILISSIRDDGSQVTEIGDSSEPAAIYAGFTPVTDLLSRQTEVAAALGGEIIYNEDPDDSFEPDSEHKDERAHPMTVLGRFATHPQTLSLPYEGYVRPVQKIMHDFSNKQLRQVCEKTFGGPGLPDSALTPKIGHLRQQVPIPIDALQSAMGSMEANAFITAVMPPVYASIMAILVETRKRLGSAWLNELLSKEGGPRILDAGAGGAGILAWKEVVRAHWESLHTSDRKSPPPPASKAVVLTGSDTLRDRAAKLLDNTTFIPRLPEYAHVRDIPTLEDERPAQARKQFDVIIASHTLLGMNEDYLRKQQVQNLWSMLDPDGGVLVLIEKGIPRGFEAIAGARDLLLDGYITSPDNQSTVNSKEDQDNKRLTSRSTGMIVAPCTNHQPCPMYKIRGKSKGRRDYCSFQQRYFRPPHLQRILGANDRNHDDVDFSYVSVMKGRNLHSKQIDSWKALEDPSSATSTASQNNELRETPSWMDITQRGFEQFTPDSIANANRDAVDIELSFTYPDGIPRSTLPTPLMFPRVVYPPLKRHGHVTLDLCTPMGKIERWTIPKSFSRQAYRDARKSRWGDLWALGAKTCIPRNLKLGDADTEEATRARKRAERLQNKAEEEAEILQERKLDALDEQRDRSRSTRRIIDTRAVGLHDDLKDWVADFGEDAIAGKGQKEAGFSKNTSSKAARRLQKAMRRSQL